MSLTTVWTQIKQETAAGANTADRVGQAGLDLVDQLEKGLYMPATVSGTTATLAFDGAAVNVEEVAGKIVRIHNDNGFGNVTSITVNLKGSVVRSYSIGMLDANGLTGVALGSNTDYYIFFPGGQPYRAICLDLSMSHQNGSALRNVTLTTTSEDDEVTLSDDYDTYFLLNRGGDVVVNYHFTRCPALVYLFIYTEPGLGASPPNTEHLHQVKWVDFDSSVRDQYLCEGITMFVLAPMSGPAGDPKLGILWSSNKDYMVSGNIISLSVDDGDGFIAALNDIPPRFKGEFRINLTRDISVRTIELMRAMNRLQNNHTSGTVAITSETQVQIILSDIARPEAPLYWTLPCTVKLDNIILIDYDNLRTLSEYDELHDYSTLDFSIAKSLIINSSKIFMHVKSPSCPLEVYNLYDSRVYTSYVYIADAPRVIAEGSGTHFTFIYTNELLGMGVAFEKLFAYPDHLRYNDPDRFPVINSYYGIRYGDIEITPAIQIQATCHIQGCMAVVTFSFTANQYAERIGQMVLPSTFPTPLHPVVGSVYVDRQLSLTEPQRPEVMVDLNGNILMRGIDAGMIYVQLTYMFYEI